MARSFAVTWLLVLLDSAFQIFVSTSSTTVPNFVGEFKKLTFKSIHKDEFRIALSAGENSTTTIWAESKNTKSQWQIKVADTSKHGPTGIPAPVVFALLKASLLPVSHPVIT
jgi:hypothetical protein